VTSTTPRAHACAASSLLAPLLDGRPRPLVEAARTRLSVHYETGHPRLPVLSVGTPDAVRLPNTLVASALPRAGPASVGHGMLSTTDATWRPRRWWGPPRPSGLAPPPDPGSLLAGTRTVRVWGDPAVPRAYDGLVPVVLLGAGPGLTPSGDDFLAGALVTAYATDDPRLATWRRETRKALAARRTTAVSRALLHHALDGYATPELADALTALCTGGGQAVAVDRLLAVGHTSGAALLAGVLHTLTTRTLRGAA
jgi:hypothetical protein